MVGHGRLRKDNRWHKTLLEFQLVFILRSVKRQDRKWTDKIEVSAGKTENSTVTAVMEGFSRGLCSARDEDNGNILIYNNITW